jgi:hypothetical protein
VGDDPLTNRRAPPRFRGTHDDPGDVLAGPPTRRRVLQEERLAPIRRERFDGHDHLIGSCFWLVDLGQLNASGSGKDRYKCSHATSVGQMVTHGK